MDEIKSLLMPGKFHSTQVIFNIPLVRCIKTLTLMENNVYLLLGPEVGEKRQYIKKVINTIYLKINGKPEIFRFFPFEKQMVEIIALLQNRLLFSAYKVVIINNIEDIKNKHDLKLLCDYCKKPAEDTCLRTSAFGASCLYRPKESSSSTVGRKIW